MDVYNYIVWLVVLKCCSVAVARKGGSHGNNHQVLQRLETLENYQRFSNNKITRLEHDFNAQTATLEEQKKATSKLEATVRQLTATLERTNRLARRNRRQYVLFKSLVSKKGLKEWATTASSSNKNQRTQDSTNHNYHRNNIPNHHNQKSFISNVKLQAYHSSNNKPKSNKSNGQQHGHSLSTSHHNKMNHNSNNGNSHQHSPHENHKSNTTHTPQHHSNHNHHGSHKLNATNTHQHHSTHNHHHHPHTDHSSSHGQPHQQNHKSNTNKNNGHSNHRNPNKGNKNHQHKSNNGNDKDHVTQSTSLHSNKEKAMITNVPMLLGSDSNVRHTNRSIDQQGHNKNLRIHSNDLDDTHGSKHQHTNHSHHSDNSDHRQHANENQKSRHLLSNETPERRRNLKTSRQAFGGIAFSVYLDHDSTIAQHETIKFNKIITNDGSGYDASTGVFTCSEAGVYMLTFSIGQRDQDHYMWAELMLNSKNLIDAVVDTYHPAQDLQGGNTVIVRLNQGDRVWIDATHNGSHVEGSGSLRLTTFSGLYLYS